MSVGVWTDYFVQHFVQLFIIPIYLPQGGSLMFCDYDYFMAGIQAQLQGWF
jgi:hypothetical protein